MEFDLSWLLIGVPLVFGLGWLASKLDSRQWKREQRDAPRAYFKGLNLLLNEQQDKAIDAFIEAVQADPDTSELHFALGNLFRRRGEYERAVRVHQHLLSRGDLPKDERDRAQYALAQDFFKAGLFDRAETSYEALKGTAFDREAALALLSLYERSREWAKAADVAEALEATGTGSFASRIANYWCELSLEAQSSQDLATARQWLDRARQRAPQSARAFVLLGQMLTRQNDQAGTMAIYGELLKANPDAFNLVAREYAQAAMATQAVPQALALLEAQYKRHPSMALLLAIALLEPAPEAQRRRLAEHLRVEPALSAATQLLQQSQARQQPLNEDEAQLVGGALQRAVRPLQRYRCAACGFESQHYFWQCPGCLSWDSYPPRWVEEL
ncbi:Lipopolysaccharide biosynthesis regulator YciM, contains six TPR domains and a predicted metal-binding C-terminal domain [Roseateles sp. YR242]|uniref:lipopolysaccharide assembly protein LapB n=1 Tax=Roseateles sp. YR242 TaxID=1855305 RepID=UPI0008CFE811|nr:lipopolysaccharide assembly protein LapB [Roseateles sp. YR242]SEL42611.1 Lipopolysaccharide biosynthesis regulator YciM, contains six TPR domains and a predicted metal-binding C-terminal domain [Roseateles sp. YR242]